MQLVIGNKNYSSWSLRPWLLLAAHGLPFEEVRIPLFTETMPELMKQWTTADKVPVLHDGGLVIWDSLAICEYVSERYLDGQGWPAALESRAVARACSAEMHSGFFALRSQLPMNCRALGRRVEMTAELQREIARIDNLWSGLRLQHAADGPWLFGAFSIADCMFAPVAFRFRTYDVSLSENAANYRDTLLAEKQMQRWLEQAKAESEVIAYAEVGETP